MDYTQKITEFRAQKSKLMADAEKAAAEGRIEDMTKIADEMSKINDNIAAMERILDESRKHAEPAGYDGALHADDGNGTKAAKQGEDCKPFASLGEQLKSIYNFRKNGVQDERLQKVNNAVLGVNEGVGADGGFALQTDFAGMILESAVQQSALLNRLDRYTCSSQRLRRRADVLGQRGLYRGRQPSQAAGGEDGPGEDDGLRLLHRRDAAGHHLYDRLLLQRLLPGR